MNEADFLFDRMMWFVPLLLSLTVHEWAHAWTAWKLGDDTARMLGRVTLNPMTHLDPVGTLLPLLGFPFGWAKPVPINPTRFHQRISMPMGVLLTAAAGPISNILLAIASYLTLAILSSLGPKPPLSPAAFAALNQFFYVLLTVNIILGLFNLLPIPPLDGSRIVEGLIPLQFRPYWAQFMSLGPMLLVAVIVVPYLIGISIFAIPMAWIRQLIWTLQ